MFVQYWFFINEKRITFWLWWNFNNMNFTLIYFYFFGYIKLLYNALHEDINFYAVETSDILRHNICKKNINCCINAVSQCRWNHHNKTIFIVIFTNERSKKDTNAVSIICYKFKNLCSCSSYQIEMKIIFFFEKNIWNSNILNGTLISLLNTPNTLFTILG